MRFTVKWNNGYWKLFDGTSFSDVCIVFREKDALSQAQRMNTSEAA